MLTFFEVPLTQHIDTIRARQIQTSVYVGSTKTHVIHKADDPCVHAQAFAGLDCNMYTPPFSGITHARQCAS